MGTTNAVFATFNIRASISTYNLVFTTRRSWSWCYRTQRSLRALYWVFSDRPVWTLRSTQREKINGLSQKCHHWTSFIYLLIFSHLWVYNALNAGIFPIGLHVRLCMLDQHCWEIRVKSWKIDSSHTTENNSSGRAYAFYVVGHKHGQRQKIQFARSKQLTFK